MSDRGGRLLMPASGRGQSSLAATLLGALTCVFGLQFLRLLVVALSVNLVQINELSSVLVGVMGLAVFALGFLAPVVHGILGRRTGVPVILGGLGLLRIAEQFSSSLPVDLALSIAGTVMFLWALPLMLRSLPGAGAAESGPHTAIALLLGLSIDTAVKGAFGTIDLSWAGGTEAHVVTAVLVAAQWSLLAIASPAWASSPMGHAAARVSWGAPCLIFGPALVLQFLTFQNVAWQTVLIGWPQPVVLAWILASNLAGVVVALWLARRRRPLHGGAQALLGGVLIVSVAVEWTGPLAAVAMPVGQVVTAMLLVSVARPGPAAARRGRAVAAWTTAGMLTLLVLLFVFYAHYDIAVPVPQAIVRPLAALVMGFAALRASMTGALVPAKVGRSAAIPALLLLAVPGIQLATLNEIEPAAGTGFPVRVMTYNIHQGFDAHGRHGMEALAQIIEAQDPDIVALQEVSRGWLINGSVDTLVWLSQRLGMAYVFGPAADQVWGNAVLSRLPIRRAGNHRMPNNDDIVMDRGFLMLEVDVGGGETLEVLATHFHNGEEEEDAAARLPQSLAVLEAADSDRTMVLLGDLNASPHHPEMLLIADAGFVDAFVLAGPPGDGYTWLSDALEQRIDYVWTSPDLRVTDFAMPMSTASDHLAIAVTVDR